MNATQHDIGGEILSILTRGMYSDPRDALREYIQNGVDARADTIDVQVLHDTIVIEDNGRGMDQSTLRNAARVGVSEKLPGQDVGFMGIGIYSSFHLCNRLTIYTRTESSGPHKMVFKFQEMRRELDKQRAKRLSNRKLKPSDYIDLQSLLKRYIEGRKIADSAFPATTKRKHGTRVEIDGVTPDALTELSDFSKVSEYLREVIPLRFNPLFSFGEAIETTISKICKEHDERFERVDLNLQINAEAAALYRPYTDGSFNKQKKAPILHPISELVSEDGEFFGVVWGCLNSLSEVIKPKKLQGFLLKKQGFTIGKREDLLRYFDRKPMYPRFSGEVIIVNRKLLPKASRDDLEYTPLRELFYEILRKTFASISTEGEKYSNRLNLEDEIGKIEKEIAQKIGVFDREQSDISLLFTKIRELEEAVKSINGKLSKKSDYEPKQLQRAKKVIETAENLRTKFKERLDALMERTPAKKKKKGKQLTMLDIAEALGFEEKEGEEEEAQFESLLEVLEDLNHDIGERLAQAINLIDDRFLGRDDSADYYEKLVKLHDELATLD